MHRPLVWLAIAFCAGIVLGKGLIVSSWGWLATAGVCALIAVVLHRFGRCAVAVLIPSVIAVGGFWYTLHAAPPIDPRLEAAFGRDVELTGHLVRPPQTARGLTRLVIAVEALRAAGVRAQVRGRVQVTLQSPYRPSYGDRIVVGGRLGRPPPAGNPGEFSYRDYLASQGISAVLSVRRDAHLRVIGRARVNPILQVAFALRERMIAFLQTAMPGPRGALLASLLLGDDGAIAPASRDAFRRSGLLHVLVVSGAQVGLVLGSILWLGRALRAPPLIASTAGGLAVIFFSLLAGWVPSVARAAIMAVMGVAALVWRRDRDLYTALALAGFILLVSTPHLLFDAGFQLSFVATWALLYIAPALADRLPVLPAPIRSLVSMTVAAQTAVMPLLAYHFLQISLIGYLANLVVVPLVVILVPAGFALALLGVLVPSLGALCATVLGPLVDAVSRAAELFSAAPLAGVPIGAPTLASSALFYVILIGAAEWLRGRLQVVRGAMLATTVLAILIWSHVLVAAGRAPLVMTFLDVGQGDAVVIQAPPGRTVMVDGGGEVEGHVTGYDVGARRVVPALRRLGLRHIDLLILTHPHEDHVGGLVAVLQNFSVGLVLDSGFVHPAPSYVQFLRLIEARRIPYQLARRGVRFELGGGVAGIVLSPTEPLLSGTGSDVNLNSVVFRLVYGAVSALFTGDVEAAVESRLLEEGDELHSTLLKVAHHGSATSTTAEFLDAVAPDVAVISVGRFNPFGHPHQATLRALEAVGAVIYRTDLHGAISASSDGQRLWIRTVRDASDR